MKHREYYGITAEQAYAEAWRLREQYDEGKAAQDLVGRLFELLHQVSVHDPRLSCAKGEDARGIARQPGNATRPEGQRGAEKVKMWRSVHITGLGQRMDPTIEQIAEGLEKLKSICVSDGCPESQLRVKMAREWVKLPLPRYMTRATIEWDCANS